MLSCRQVYRPHATDNDDDDDDDNDDGDGVDDVRRAAIKRTANVESSLFEQLEKFKHSGSHFGHYCNPNLSYPA